MKKKKKKKIPHVRIELGPLAYKFDAIPLSHF